MRERHGGHNSWATRLVAGASGAAMLVVAFPAYAQDDEESAGSEEICAIHDPRVADASGIAVASDDGWWVLPDGNGQTDGLLTIRKVGADCNVRDTEAESIAVDWLPIDPEDIALDGEGYLWTADIGTDVRERNDISLTQVEIANPANFAMTRYVYPDGMQDAEAYLLLPDRTPVFIPAVEGEAPLYAPQGEMMEHDTPLEQVGTGTLTEGGTATGAAINADGSKVVIRTASHAYEWDVSEGNVIEAIADSEPRVTPLEGEGDGQGIAYDSDGNFVTVSQTGDDAAPASIRRYTPLAPEPEEPAPGEGDDAADDGEGDDGGGFVDFLLDLGFENIVRILAGIAVVGFLVMLGGILAIRKSRRERTATESDDIEMGFAREESVFGDLKHDEPPDPVELGLDHGQPDPEVGQLAQGSVYGAPKAEPTGNVYGAARSAPAGNVYGANADEGAGAVYGAGAAAEPTGSVYGGAKSAPPQPEAAGAVYGAAREEPQYDAFEGAGQGSIYNDGGGSFAAEPPPPPPPSPAPVQPAGGTYGAPRDSAGGVYGGPSVGSGSVYGGGAEQSAGAVYGERTPEQPEDDYWGPPDGGGGYGRGR